MEYMEYGTHSSKSPDYTYSYGKHTCPTAHCTRTKSALRSCFSCNFQTLPFSFEQVFRLCHQKKLASNGKAMFHTCWGRKQQPSSLKTSRPIVLASTNKSDEGARCGISSIMELQFFVFHFDSQVFHFGAPIHFWDLLKCIQHEPLRGPRNKTRISNHGSEMPRWSRIFQVRAVLMQSWFLNLHHIL